MFYFTCDRSLSSPARSDRLRVWNDEHGVAAVRTNAYRSGTMAAVNAVSMCGVFVSSRAVAPAAYFVFPVGLETSQQMLSLAGALCMCAKGG